MFAGQRGEQSAQPEKVSTPPHGAHLTALAIPCRYRLLHACNLQIIFSSEDACATEYELDGASYFASSLPNFRSRTLREHCERVASHSIAWMLPSSITIFLDDCLDEHIFRCHFAACAGGGIGNARAVARDHHRGMPIFPGFFPALIRVHRRHGVGGLLVFNNYGELS